MSKRISEYNIYLFKSYAATLPKELDKSAANRTVMLAAVVILTVPVPAAYAFANKYFVEGLTAGAVKGSEMKEIYTGKEFIFGGDYNPEQWKRHLDILEEAVRLMKLAGCNAMPVGIFAWSEIEPEEGVYNFDFMDSVIDILWENGIKTILATPRGARPAWLSKKYPEVLRTNEYFIQKHHGERNNHCYTSPIYREKVKKIDREIALHYKNHPGIMMWHISN